MPMTLTILQLRRFIFTSLLFFLFISNARIATAQTPSQTEMEQGPIMGSPHLTPQLLKEFMAEDTSSEKNGGYVKFVIWLDEQTKDANWLIFMNSHRLRYHADLLMTMPDFKGLSRQQIDDLALTSKSRRFLFGTLFVRSGSANSPTPFLDFEISSQDDLSLNNIVQAHRILSRFIDLSLRENIRYAPQPMMVESAKQFASEFAKYNIDVVIPGQTTRRVVYHDSWSVGRVRVLTATQVESLTRTGGISPFDILVVDRVPREIPPVAGIITATPTVASSHVALLAKMLDIPLVLEPGAFTSSHWTSLDNQFVFLKSGEFKITTLTNLKKSTIDRLLEIKFPKTQLQPSLDLKRRDIVRVATLREKDRAAYGGKAAQLGLVIQMFPKNSPEEALAIPASFFADYLASAKLANGLSLRSFIQAKLKSIAPMQTDLGTISVVMNEIRETMKNTPIPPVLLRRVTDALQTNFQGPQVRLKLRSSSNIEDDETFNGAGLYDSEGAWLSGAPTGKEKQTIERALNKVWRSLYSERAYLSRRRFGVNESKVAMAVLVQRAYKGEVANGVAIGLMDPMNAFSATVTGFPGEDLLVTHPIDDKQPEIMNVLLDGTTPQLRKLQSCSEIPSSQNLLTPAEYKTLTQMMKAIFVAWPRPSERLQLDFEWKLMQNPNGGRDVIIKQVRPVPQPRLPMVGGKSTVLFVPHREMKFVTTYEESQEAVAFLLRPREVSVEMELLTGADLKSGRTKADRIRLTLSSGRVYEYTNVTARIEPGDFGNHMIWFDLPNPEFPSLNLVINLQFMDDEPVMTVESGRARVTPLLRVATKDLISFRKEIPVETGFWQWMLMSKQEVDNLSLYKRDIGPLRMSLTANNNISIEIAGTFWDLGGVGNLPAFADLTEMRIRGLISREIVIKNPVAMAFAPFHHDIGHGFAADLFGAEGLSEADRQALRKLKARYLLISRGAYMTSIEARQVIGYFDESGLFTPLYKGPNQIQ